MKSNFRISNNCLQNIFYTILLENKKNPFWMYRGSWGFGFSHMNQEILGNRIFPSRDRKWIDCTLFPTLKECYGLCCSMYTCEKSLLKKILENIKYLNYSIILEVDIFFCSWHFAFEKYHDLHYCYAVGSDAVGVKCFVPDKCTVEYLTWEVIPEKINVLVCEFKKETITKCDEILGYIKEQRCIKYKNMTSLEQLGDFLYYMKNIKINMAQEKEGYDDLRSVPLIRSLEWIVWSRINVRDMLIELTSELIIIELFDSLVQRWSALKNFFVKYFIIGMNIPQEQIIPEIVKIIDMESEIEKNLKNSTYINKR